MPRYFDFEVSLLEPRPKIWRRFLLSTESTTFHDLHEAIQMACGWEERHLFQFTQPGSGARKLPIAGIPDEEDRSVYERKLPDARRVRLESYFGQDKSIQCLYLYDLGDHWVHEVNLLGEADLKAVFKRRLQAGARAFPPEDCGGVTGYNRFLQVVEEGKDPWKEDVVELWAWLGKWDPERFDLEELKARFDQ